MNCIFIDELEIKIDYIKEDTENPNAYKRVVIAGSACDRVL